jgi:hypothetical protein
MYDPKFYRPRERPVPVGGGGPARAVEQCPFTIEPEGIVYRCELAVGHVGQHRSSRGLITWGVGRGPLSTVVS